MTGTAMAASAVASAAFTLPALGFAIGPVFDRQPDVWQVVGRLEDFTALAYKPVVITLVPGIGEVGLSLAYVRLHDDALDGPVTDRYDHIVALSSRCTHVGCPVRYVQAAESFVCPCHGGVYNYLGERVGGPPPRPLDRFFTLIKDDLVYIGPRYSLNNQLERFSPRDPGEPLDGIGRYLYPGRFSTAPAPPGA
jgi:quinol---cytochrome c reductase iron-sulfur subunit, bacillus type